MVMKLLYYNMRWKKADEGVWYRVLGQHAVSMYTFQYIFVPMPSSACCKNLNTAVLWHAKLIFFCWCKSHCSNIRLALLTKRKYQIPSKIPTYYLRIFVFSVAPPNNCWNSTLNHASTSIVNVLPTSPFTVITVVIAIHSSVTGIIK